MPVSIMAGAMDEVDPAKEKLMADMSLPCVLRPILRDLEGQSYDTTLVREALDSVETFYPGFSHFFINGILNKAQIQKEVDFSEAILKLEGSGDQEDIRIRRQDPVFRDLQLRSSRLKLILGRIPAEIADRKKFLDTIKDIAQAIKHLLDAVNEVFGHIHSMEEKNNLDKKKREFVKYSKKFSQTLKEFFKDNRDEQLKRRSAVYLSANHLIHQTNQILYAVA